MKKIDVLKKAIEKLEGGFEIKWTKTESCNAGLLAQACLGVDGYELGRRLNDMGLWKKEAERQAQCKTTGIPLNEVFAALFDAGFTDKEIGDLEFLANEEILKLTGKPYELYYNSHIDKNINLHFSNSRNLLNYLRAWLKLEQSKPTRPAMIQPSDKVRRVYVTVDKEIRKLETNLN